MYGEPVFVLHADRRQAGSWHAGLNAELHLVNEHDVEHGSHAHLSAVAVLRELPSDTGHAAVRLDVFETISDQCVPLPATVFAHQGDKRWGVVGPGQYGRRGDGAH